MTSIAVLAAPFAAGLLAGLAFFGGLWWTVRRGLAMSQPALWFAGSTLARMAILVLVFYSIAAGGAADLLACLLGVLMARVVINRLTRLSQ